VSTPRRSAPARTPGAVEGPATRDVVIRVSDGDTVKLQNAGTVRLIGVDCPEKVQPGGQDAKAFTTSALMGKTIELEVCAKQPHNRYGRTLGFIYLLDRSGRRVLFNAELVRQGYANVYSLRPCTVDEDLWNGYQAEARQARRGLFATLREVPDAAAFRRAQKH
jgi:micrococcal nuclease